MHHFRMGAVSAHSGALHAPYNLTKQKIPLTTLKTQQYKAFDEVLSNESPW